MFGFICHRMFQERPCLSYLRSTSKRIDIQIREDNSDAILIVTGGSSCELCGFIHGSSSHEEREKILSMMRNQTQVDLKSNTQNSPWSIRDKMIKFAKSCDALSQSNLLFTKTCALKEKAIA